MMTEPVSPTLYEPSLLQENVTETSV